MLRIHNVKIGLHQKEYKKIISQTLNIREKDIISVQLVKKSVDARHQRINFICSFDFEVADEQKVLQSYPQVRQVKPLEIPMPKQIHHYVIVGQGLVGMVCAYILSMHHQKVTIIDRGLSFEERLKQSCTYENIYFGEGGSSLFLQEQWLLGKNQPLVRYIVDLLMECGVSSEVVNLAKFYLCHSDSVQVIRYLKEKMLDQDVRFYYQSQCVDFDNTHEPFVKILHQGKEKIITCDEIILACGNHAKEMIPLLEQHHVTVEKKPYALGLVLRLLQNDLNTYQYGENYEDLPPADFSFAHRDLHVFLQNLYPHSQALVLSQSQDGLSFIKNNSSPYTYYQLMVHGNFDESTISSISTAIHYSDKLGVQTVEDFLLNQESQVEQLLDHEYLCDYTKILPKECVDSLQVSIRDNTLQQHAVIVGIAYEQSVRIQNENESQHIHVIGKATGNYKNTMSALCDGVQCALDVLKGE